MLIAIIAAACMVVTDIIATVEVQAEAANRGWLAGFCDLGGWYVAVTTTTISVDTLGGHGSLFSGRKLEVLILVGAANLFGTRLGVLTGGWILHRWKGHVEGPTVDTLSARIDEIERALGAK